MDMIVNVFGDSVWVQVNDSAWADKFLESAGQLSPLGMALDETEYAALLYPEPDGVDGNGECGTPM